MFNLQRFMRLANAHWTEYRKAYAWFIGIGVMIHFVVLLIIFMGDHGYTNLSTAGQQAIYYAGLFLTAPIFAARYFQLMAKKESALLILMRPASIFEKWLLAFIVVALLYPAVYTLAFYICNTPAWLIAKTQASFVLIIDEGNAASVYRGNEYLDQYELFFIFRHTEAIGNLITVALSLTVLQAFAVLGSLYFRAMPFIKTMLIAFFILLAAIFLTAVFDARIDAIFDYWSRQRHYLSAQQQFLYPFMWTSLPVLLWLSCFFALKEKEVA
ncbi:MAG: hypothetical protein ACREO1_15075 [Arenimonas sp.]